jgi:hypothetical protein
MRALNHQLPPVGASILCSGAHFQASSAAFDPHAARADLCKAPKAHAVRAYTYSIERQAFTAKHPAFLGGIEPAPSGFGSVPGG